MVVGCKVSHFTDSGIRDTGCLVWSKLVISDFKGLITIAIIRAFFLFSSVVELIRR